MSDIVHVMCLSSLEYHVLLQLKNIECTPRLLAPCPDGNVTPTVYRVVEAQGTTFTVEPLEGGPYRRVHRVGLHPCVNPAVELAATEGGLEAPATQFPPEKGGVENVDPECVVLEVVTWPLEEIRNVDVSRSAEELIAVESDLVQDCGEQYASESEQSMEHIPSPVINNIFSKRPVPTPRRTN